MPPLRFEPSRTRALPYSKLLVVDNAVIAFVVPIGVVYLIDEAYGLGFWSFYGDASSWCVSFSSFIPNKSWVVF